MYKFMKQNQSQKRKKVRRESTTSSWKMKRCNATPSEMLTRSLHIADWSLVGCVRSLVHCFVRSSLHCVWSGCRCRCCYVLCYENRLSCAVWIVQCSHNFTLKIPISKATRERHVHTQQARQWWRRRRRRWQCGTQPSTNKHTYHRA